MYYRETKKRAAAPEYDRPWVPSTKSAELAAKDVKEIPWTEALKTLMGCPDVASRRWVWEQYDHMVMADTTQRPGGDAAVVRIHGTNRGLAISTDCTPRYVKADPFEGGKQAVAETWRNLTAVGARPLAVTDNLNFGNPEKPEIMGQLVMAVKGIGEACKALDFPIVSGNVSLYNETNGLGILPTPTIGGVGVIPDWQKTARIAFAGEGEAVLLFGAPAGYGGHLGQSAYLRIIHGREEGPPPPVDLAHEKKIGDFVRMLRQQHVERGNMFVAGRQIDQIMLRQQARKQRVHAVLGIAHRHGARGVAVIAALEGNEPCSPLHAAIDPELQRHLQRHFDGDRAGIGKEHAIEIARQQRRQPPRQRQGLLVHQPAEHHVRHRRELAFHGRADMWMVVAVAGGPPAGDAIDQFAPVRQHDA